MKEQTTPRQITKIHSAPRLRVRRLNEHSLIQSAVQKAQALGKPSIQISHGGAVNNSYNYPADTEGGVAVGFPDGSSYCIVERLPANKVTLSGVFYKTTGLRGLYDYRFSDCKRRLVRKEFLERVKKELARAETFAK